MTALLFDAAVLSIDFWIAVLLLIGIAGILNVGIQLNAGSSGLLNVGSVGFMAIGAYGMAILVTDLGFPLLVASGAAIGLAVAAAMLVGLASLRLRAHYFAIATIAFAETVRLIAQNARRLTGGNQGVSGFDDGWNSVAEPIQESLAGIGLPDSHLVPLLLLTWAVFLIALTLVSLAMRTPWGRVVAAVRDDEDAAAALGKNVLAYKLQSLAIAAALAAVAGILFALDVRLLVPSEFEPTLTFLGYAAVVLGGLGSYRGVLIGTVVIWAVVELTRFLDLPLSADRIAAIRYIVIGAVLVVLSMARPQGVLGDRRQMVLRRD